MDIRGYFTARGLILSAKLASGKTLEITRVAAGSGHTDKPSAATALPQMQQELAVNTPTSSGSTAVIPATLVAAQARSSYSLTELGVYAKDPDEGEILYKVYQLSEAMDITAGSRTVLRFYLEETLSQDLGITVVCSPAGLLTEEAFSQVKEITLARTAPYRYVYLEASQVQAFLDALPRFLTESIFIYLSGTLEAPLMVRGFHGNGTLVLIKDPNAETCSIQQILTVSQCSVHVFLSGLTFQKAADATDACLQVSHSYDVYLTNCTFTGSGTGKGIFAEKGSMVYMDGCAFSGFSTVLQVERASLMSITADAANFHNNSCGAYVWRGGIVLLCGGTPTLLGGNYNTKAGGMIVATDGTLL